VEFAYLLKDIETLGWWQSDIAGLVDDSGNCLAHTEAAQAEGHQRLGEGDAVLEKEILAQIKKNTYGTILGPGHPPERVGGFHRLERAPWALVRMAPGNVVHQPILRLRFYYALAGISTITGILVLIWWVGGKSVAAITEMAGAADAVSKGNYGPLLTVKREDEIGLLQRRFNSMIAGLKEWDLISNTFGRYVDPEIAKTLLNRPEAARLGGEKREVAVLISDIRGFTLATEGLDPQSVIQILNSFYVQMITVIQAHRGIPIFSEMGLWSFSTPLRDPSFRLWNRPCAAP